MRLTVDLIEKSAAFTNSLGLRELDLRSNKIPAVENLAVTKDLFDVLDLSDNDLLKLDNFPSLKRLKHLLCSNNQIKKIDIDFSSKLPSLEVLVLSGNKIASFDDIQLLASAKSLLHLSLLDNPITELPAYRLHVVSMVPNLRTLDFQRVTLKERGLAQNVLRGDARQSQLDNPKPSAARLASSSNVQAAIEQASTLEEVENLRRTLQAERRK